MTDTLANRLATARKALGVTQDGFCTRTGMPKSSLQKYEGGHSVPGADALAMIAKAGINVHWLITGTSSMLTSDAPVKPAAPKINVDALIQAFVGMSQGAPPGETTAQTARKAIEFYNYLIDRGMITPDGIGEGDLSSAA